MAGLVNRITVLLVDDHAVVREGYRRLLERPGDIEVVGEASDGEAACEMFGALAPQVVVMDITLPGANGIQAMRRMLAQRPGSRVLIFSMHEEAIFARRALQAGALGYVAKSDAPEILVEAVHRIARGERYLSATMARDLALHNVDSAGAPGEGLTARELEVLRLLVQGRSVRDIAKAIGLNPKTVANHQSAIKHKLGAETPLQLLQAAGRLGLALGA